MVVAIHVRPCLTVNTVHADKADLPAVDKLRECPHHVKILIIIKAPVLRGEDQYGVSFFTVGLIFHIAVQIRAVVFFILYFHCRFIIDITFRFSHYCEIKPSHGHKPRKTPLPHMFSGGR